MQQTTRGGITRRFSIGAGISAITMSIASRAWATEPSPPPHDGRKIEASGGGDLPPDYKNIDPKTGGQKAYAVLTPEERAKGFVRPYRDTYTHLRCGTSTSMSKDIAETFAADPKFYNAAYCVHCRGLYPLKEFVWAGTNEMVGS